MKHVEGMLQGFDGCHLFYQNWQPEGISQAIVVLVHGLGGHSGGFQNVVEYLISQNYEVYALDLRGHGRSEGQRGYINRWQEFREDLHSLLQHIRLRRACCPCVLWGHSLGGTIVLDYILNRPDRINGAIVTAPALGKVNISPIKLGLGRLLSKVWPRFSLKLGLHRDDHPSETAIAYEQDPLRHEYGSARLATEFLATVDWIYRHAAEMKVPLLIMHGTADLVTLPEGSRAFFQRVIFPDKEHREYPDHVHDLYLEDDSHQIFTDLEIWLDCHLTGAPTCQPFLDNALQQANLIPLGHTLPALLDQACQRNPNATAFNQWTEGAWRSLSNQDFKQESEAMAMGLLGLGLDRGDRVALLMPSDLKFAIADMGCLLAGMVDVPLDLSQTLEHIFFALENSGAKALFIADLDLLKQIAPYLDKASQLKSIIIAEAPKDWSSTRLTLLTDAAPTPPEGLHPIPAEACLDLHPFLFGLHSTPQEFTLPPGLKVLAWEEVRSYGLCRLSPGHLQGLRSPLKASDLATIIYIPDEAGKWVGVMLTHENLSGNAVAAFASMPNLAWGDREVVLSFLPLNHVFARCLLYGHLYYGHSIYFSHPHRVLKHIGEVQPTIFATVPFLLEKLYSKIIERGKKLPTWWQRQIFVWALGLAQRYPLGKTPRGMSALALRLADHLVYRQWRAALGDRLKYLLSGGAALRSELTNVFNIAGIPVYQGYGLTQTSGVVSFNRRDNNRAGTVGSPIPGVEIAIADDGEILVRGLYITLGYYQNPEATQGAIDAQGWLHTGDLGSFTAQGLLQITGLKKSLFKLSTGKYIAPQPLEDRLIQSNLIKQAIIVGADHKFCATLIVPDLDILRDRAEALGFEVGDHAISQHPCLLPLYQAEIDAINCHLPYWGAIKRFKLIDLELTLENGLLTVENKINRAAVNERFAAAIASFYRESETASLRSRKHKTVTQAEQPIPTEEPLACPTSPAIACPIFTQSLQP